MGKVPITFEHEGQHYSGTLDSVQGTGASLTWHLTIDKYYWGQLRRYNESWVFDPTPKNESMAQLADYFGEQVVTIF